jgi:DNA-binding protein HU-beta
VKSAKIFTSAHSAGSVSAELQSRELIKLEQVTKQQLIEAVASNSDRPKQEVEAVVESLLGEIGKALQSGDRIDLRGFGSFIVKDKAARQGRNPKTGETIQIAARKAATFKPSKELSDRLASRTAAS